VAPLLASLLAPAWGRVGDRCGMKLMIERCTLAMALHWVFFGLAGSVYHLLILRIALGLSGGFATLSMPLLVATTPKDHMSRSIGVLQTVQMISSAVGPMIGGMLADWIGIRRTCMVSAVLASSSLALVHFLYRDPEDVASSAGGSAACSISFRQAIGLPAFGLMMAVLFIVNFVERGFAPVIPIDSGANQETAVVASITGGGRGGGSATITVAAPLKSAHAAGAQVSGSGITLTAALTQAHASGAQVAGNVPTPGAPNQYSRKGVSAKK